MGMTVVDVHVSRGCFDWMYVVIKSENDTLLILVVLLILKTVVMRMC